MADKNNKKQNILTMDVKDIGKALKKKGNTKLPSKTQMNLYVKQADGNSLSRVIPIAFILAVLVFVVYQVGVVSRLAKLNELMSERNNLENTLQAYETKLKDYDKIQSDYYQYTRFYLTNDESGLVEKTQIMNLIEETIDPLAVIVNTDISGNNVSLSVYAENLEAFASMRKSLLEHDWVSDVMVYNAAYSEREGSVFGNISFSVTK